MSPMWRPSIGVLLGNLELQQSGYIAFRVRVFRFLGIKVLGIEV